MTLPGPQVRDGDFVRNPDCTPTVFTMQNVVCFKCLTKLLPDIERFEDASAGRIDRCRAGKYGRILLRCVSKRVEKRPLRHGRHDTGSHACPIPLSIPALSQDERKKHKGKCRTFSQTTPFS